MVCADHIVLRQRRIDSGYNGVYLRSVSGTKHRQRAEQRIQHRQKLLVPTETVFNVIHRPADPLAGLAALTKMYRQRNFRKLCAHTEQCGTPHPEYRARAAYRNSARHTGNVARALVDLERNGRLKPDAAAQDAPKSAEKKASTAAASKSKGGFMHFINKLYRARVKVARQSIPILNISLLFTLVAALISPHLLILSAILILLLGYRVSFDKDAADFAQRPQHGG